MEDWVERALKRWPNVPALYGWLKLDRRGRWLIKGESISRPQIIDVINRNYAADERGCWYFQNGPQRGYMQLERAPLIVHVAGTELRTHNQLSVTSVNTAFLDEEGGIYLQTEHGPAAMLDTDLEWAASRMRKDNNPVDDSQLAIAMALSSGTKTQLSLQLAAELPIYRLDNADAPQTLGFVREPAAP